uniref:Major facilitator superfamily (MFS) profile domain-containing protein n=1 Tax=Stomoxys calcitrans TaxID=35570 RepID=A0A1I8P2T6_STOCA
MPSQKDKWHTINLNSEVDNDASADFETAVKACGFGRFNILLLCVSIPAIMACVFETAVMSYILPSAECDLSLDLVDKGILNAIAYAGMIVSAIGWGYLADRKGRRNLLIFGYLMDGLCVLCAAISQSIVQLMVAKFFGGFVISGPFAILMSYLAEFHDSNHRSHIMMIVGIMFATANISLPVLALLILPNDWNFEIFNMNFVAWKVFVAVSAIPSILSTILFGMFPESPRFLMSQGRNDEAMETFKKMYALNTGKLKETYPIKSLNEETQQKTPKNRIATIATTITEMNNPNPNLQHENDTSEAIKQPNTFRVLCSKPYLGLCIMVCIMQFFVLLGLNTLRLWLPQLFASLNEYKHLSSESTSMCTVLEYSVNKTELVKDPTSVCNVIITPASYTNNIVVACAMFIAYLVAGTLINALGTKRIQGKQ